MVAMDPIDQRDRLIDRAKYGEITGAQADAEAIRLGLGSLSRRPAADVFRPEGITDWTLPMALAWIVYLDLDEVRQWYAPFVAECWHWVHQTWRDGPAGQVYTGWLLEQSLPPTVNGLGIASIADSIIGTESRATMSVSEAQKALWGMLREGFLVASGLDTRTGRRVEIPALDWHDLVAIDGPGHTVELKRGPSGDGFRDVLVPSTPIRSYWRRVEPPVLTLPDVVPPVGHGYFPLFLAALWIATRGGKDIFDPADLDRWRPAFRDLLDAIASEAVKVVGKHGHQTQPVPPHLFVGIAVDYPFADLSIETMLSNELVLRSYPFVDEEHWRSGFDDALVDRGGDRWTRLSVDKASIARLWPFGDPLPPMTGTPGRPTSAHLFLPEMERRSRSGTIAGTVSGEAKYLSQWLQEHHPAMPQAKPNSVEETIRARYWELKGRK